MYGALVPWLQGEIFRWIGPNNVSGRALSLVSALLTVTVIAVSMKNGRSPMYLVIGWAAILGVNHRSGHYFAENRPDMPALLFATLALVLFWCGQERRRGLYFVLGSACLVVGFFIKQTVAIFSAVPLVVLLLLGRRPRRSEALLALLPLAISTATVLLLKILCPTVYHYMVEVPGGYSINWPRFIKFLWEVLLDSPLFLFLLGEWIVYDETLRQRLAAMLWLLSRAGRDHSCLQLRFRMPRLADGPTACCRLSWLDDGLLRAQTAVRYWNASRALASPLSFTPGLRNVSRHLALDDDIPPSNGRERPAGGSIPWNQEYWKVVSIARSLPGTVVCPEDPTIPLHARQLRRAEHLLRKRIARPSQGQWPKATRRITWCWPSFAAADFVVDVANYWGDNVDDSMLLELGFEPAEDFPLDAECYRIWRRSEVDRAGPGSRTALLETRGPTADQSPPRVTMTSPSADRPKSCDSRKATRHGTSP